MLTIAPHCLLLGHVLNLWVHGIEPYYPKGKGCCDGTTMYMTQRAHDRPANTILIQRSEFKI